MNTELCVPTVKVDDSTVHDLDRSLGITKEVVYLV